MGPCRGQIMSHDVSQVLPPDGSVQGADHVHRDAIELLEDGLDLAPVLSDDVGVVPPGLVQVLPVEVGLVRVQRTGQGLERSESVGGEEDPLGDVVREHDLGPVDHHGEHEAQGVSAGGDLVALLDLQFVLGLDVVEVVQHVERLAVPDDGDLGPGLQDLGDARPVVGLHVVDDEVVQVPPVQGGAEVAPVLSRDGRVAGVQQAGLLVLDQIAVVGYTLRDGEGALEDGCGAIVAADPVDVVPDGDRVLVRVCHGGM